LQAAQSKPPDVVVLGLTLPDLDAWEVAKRLQELSWEKKPFFIALADHEDKEDRCRSWQAGIDLHLVKPVATDFLREFLEKLRRIIMPSSCKFVGGPSVQ
jgi:DNA-binding response OmpR family regulator